MASADELRQAIVTNRQKLGNAISGATSKWDAGSDDNWGARKIAEHCIGSEAAFAGMVAGAMQSKAPEAAQPSFETAADATAALTMAAEACDKVYRYVEDHDLNKAAPMPDGIPFPKTIEGVFQLAAYHIDDHASQIANA